MLSQHLINLLRNARDSHNGWVAEAAIDKAIWEPLARAGVISFKNEALAALSGDPPGWYVTVIGEEQIDRAGAPTLFDGVTRANL